MIIVVKHLTSLLLTYVIFKFMYKIRLSFAFFKLKINSLYDVLKIQSKYVDLWVHSDIYTTMEIKNIS